MNEKIDKVISVVCEHFDISQEQLKSTSRKIPIPMAKKMIILLLPDVNIRDLAEALNNDFRTVYHHRGYINQLCEVDLEIKKTFNILQSKLEYMNLKLKPAQLGSLYEMFESFLSMTPDSVTLELICLLIEEIKEKCRKKFRSGKENLSLDEKQVRAFLIWYHHFGGMFETKHPYGHMTLLDIINQIKPIAHAQRITLQN